METKEIYILCKERSQVIALQFLERFLPSRKPSALDYLYPQYNDNPEIVYRDCEQLIEKLERELNQPYSLYWDNVNDNPIRNAMLFFTADGNMISGLAVMGGEDKDWLEKISSVVGGNYGYVSFEEPPPDDTQEFIEICQTTVQSRLVNRVIKSSRR